jgi:hypothetical protein
MTHSFCRHAALVLAFLSVSACAASATAPLPKTSAWLRGECEALARREATRHGVDELASLPAICARLEAAITAHRAHPASAAPDVSFAAAYDDCLTSAKHRGAMFTYRGHPGDRATYQRVRAVCNAYQSLFLNRNTGV